MTHTLDLCVFRSNEQKTAHILEMMKEQTVQADRVFTVDASGSDAAVPYMEALNQTEAEYLLLLSDELDQVGVDLTERLMKDLTETDAVLSEASILPGKGTGLYRDLLESFPLSGPSEVSQQVLYENGVSAFLFHGACTLVRTEPLRNCVMVLDCVTHPFYLAAAQLVYSGYTLKHNEAAAVRTGRFYSTNALLKRAYDFGAAQKLYFQMMGITTDLTKTRRDWELGGKRILVPPVVKKNMGQFYMELLKRCSGRKPYMAPVYLHLLSFSALNDWIGNHYYRFPAFVTRMLSGHADRY